MKKKIPCLPASLIRPFFWLVGFLFLNLLLFHVIHRHAFIRRPFLLTLSKTEATAQIGDILSEASLNAQAWEGLDIRVVSPEQPIGLFPVFRIQKMEVDGVVMPQVAREFPRTTPTHSLILGRLISRFLGNQPPCKDSSQDEAFLAFGPAERLSIQGEIVHPHTLAISLDMSFRDLSGEREVKLLVTPEGALVWRIHEQGKEFEEQGSATFEFFRPRADFSAARFCSVMLAYLLGAFYLLAEWLRWTLIVGGGMLIGGLVSHGGIRIWSRLKPARINTRFRGYLGRKHFFLLIPILAAMGVWILLIWLRDPWGLSLPLLMISGCAGTFLLFFSFWEIGATREWGKIRGRHQRAEMVTVTILAVLAFASSAWISLAIYDASPHVQDEVSYVAAARAMASGQLGFEIPPGTENSFEIVGFLRGDFRENILWPYWPGTFQFFYPLVLSLPAKLGLEWLVNPLLGGLLLAILYLFARKYYGVGPAFLAAVLFLVSPFSRTTSASLMSTTFTGLLTVLAVVFLLLAMDRGSFILGAVSGLAIGGVVNCRAFDGLIVLIGITITSVAALFQVPLKRWIKAHGGVFLGGVCMAVPFFWQARVLGFFSAATSDGGIMTLFTDFDLYGMYERVLSLDNLLIGWPDRTGPGLILLGILLLPVNRKLWLTAFWALLFPAGYLFFAWHGVMYGPRYWYPSLPAMVLLMALTLWRLGNWTFRLGKTAWPWKSGILRQAPLLAVLAGFGLWLWPYIVHIPSLGYSQRLEFKQDFNEFRFDYREIPSRHGLSNAVIFLGNNLGWQRHCSALGDNTREGYHGSILYASYSPLNVNRIRNAYPNRTQYHLVMAEEKGNLELYQIKRETEGGDIRFEPVPEPSEHFYKLGEDCIFTGLPARYGSPMIGGMHLLDSGGLVTSMAVRGRVFLWDSNGTLQGVYGATFSEHPGALASPQNITVDALGVIHVADIRNPGVVRFTRNGDFIGRYAPSVDEHAFERPVGLLALEDGSSVVVEEGRNRLTRIAPDGTGSVFFPDQVFAHPVACCSGPGGWIWVLDMGAGQLVGIDSEGHRTHEIPLTLTGSRVIERGLYMAANERFVVVSDYPASAFWVVDMETRIVRRLGSLDSTPRPTGVAIRNGVVFYLSEESNRVRRYDLIGSNR